MTDLYRVRAVWTGFPGGPGITTLFGLVGVPMVPSLRAFFLSLAGALPNDVTIQVQDGGDIIQDTTGDLVGAWTAAPVLPVTGSSGLPYAAPVGAEVVWNTTTIVDGHRLKGRTFLVPMSTALYDTDGTINATFLGSMQSTADTFFAAASGDLVVWHRPRKARAADGSRPAVTARAGGHGVVTGTVVADKAVILRSRRD